MTALLIPGNSGRLKTHFQVTVTLAFLLVALMCLLIIIWRKNLSMSFTSKSILRLHSVSYLGTENLFIVSLNKSGYLLLGANGSKQVHHICFLWHVLFIFWSVLATSLCLIEVKSKLVKSKYHRADRDSERWSSAFHCPRQTQLYLCHQGSVRNLTFIFSRQAQHFNPNPLNEQLVNVGIVVAFYLGIYTEI